MVATMCPSLDPITLLASGPSLRRTWSGKAPGPVVAINCTIDQVPGAAPDWWATGELADPLTWGRHLRYFPRPKIGIATDPILMPLVREPLAADDLARWWPLPGSPRQFTGPMALAWCLNRWPEEQIECHGFDLGGDRYANGARVHGVGDRWAIERQAMRAILATANGRAVRMGFSGWGDVCP
jgi:hypothetical protein